MKSLHLSRKSGREGGSILSFLIIFALGIIVGAGGLYGFAAYRTHQILSSQKPVINTQQPSTQPQGQSSSTDVQNNANQVQQRLFQQGISLTDTVDTVYAGAGFIIKDSTGTKMFVLWKGNAPTTGEQVKVEGPLANAREDLSSLQSLSGFTSDLGSFLQSQPVYLKATQVTPMSATPTP